MTLQCTDPFHVNHFTIINIFSATHARHERSDM